MMPEPTREALKQRLDSFLRAGAEGILAVLVLACVANYLTMAMLGMLLSVVGLVLVLAAGIVLLRYIFVPEDELTLLAELPLEPSTTHLTSEDYQRTARAAITNIVKLQEYRERFVPERRKERCKGRWDFGLLIGGSCFQIAGVIVGYFSLKP